MRPSVGLMLGLLVGAPGLTGCGPAVPREDLGTVLEEAPEIPSNEESAGGPKSPSPSSPGTEPSEPGSEP
jgi:hypothetical protein